MISCLSPLLLLLVVLLWVLFVVVRVVKFPGAFGFVVAHVWLVLSLWL